MDSLKDKIMNHALNRLCVAAGLALTCLIPTYAANLKQLTLQATGGVELTPAFSPDRRAYQVAVQSDISSIQVQALADGADAALSITVNGKLLETKPSMQAPLNTGSNSIHVRVDSNDYEITVTRQDVSAVTAKFLKLTFTDTATGVAMPYRLYVPEKMAQGQKYPLVVFLHGGGERGSDNEKTLTANQGGTVWAMPEEQAKHAAFVLVPQAREVWDGGFGVTRNPQNEISLGKVFTLAEDTKSAHKLLMKVLQEYPQIDQQRLYAVGLSQGGFGVWGWNTAYPDLFAAIVAMCSGADPQTVGVLRNKPIWAFHAASDPVIPVDYSRQSVKALRDLGSKVRYTEYPADTYFYPMAHFSWVPTLRNKEMRDWLFEQKKSEGIK